MGARACSALSGRPPNTSGFTRLSASSGPGDTNASRASYALPLARGESLEWLNELVKTWWPHVDKAVQKIVTEKVEPKLREKLPGPLQNGTSFKEFTLGRVTPKLGPIKIYRTEIGVQILLSIDYQSDVDIELQTPVASIGIKSLKVSGELTIRMEPTLNEMPVVGGTVVYFQNPPSVDIQFTGLAKVASFPGLAGKIRSAIDSVVASTCVLPNVIATPLGTAEQGVDRASLNQPTPMGVLRLTAVSAKDLYASDWNLMGKATSDPYVRVQIADQDWESSVVKKTCSPSWPATDVHEFVIYDREQLLRIDVFDEDKMSSDDLIGRAAPITIAEAVSMWSEKPIPLLGPKEFKKKCGSLVLKFEMLDLPPKDNPWATNLASDGYLVMVKIEDVLLPKTLGEEASIAAELLGVRKQTQAGKHPNPQASSDAVENALREVAKRCKAEGLTNQKIATVLGVDDYEVPYMLGEVVGSARHGVGSLVQGNAPLAMEVETVLFFPVPSANLEDADITLTLIGDKKVKDLSEVKVSMKDVFDSSNLTRPGPISFPRSGFDHIEAQIEISVCALTPMTSTSFSR